MDKKMKYTAIIDADTKHFMKKSKKVMKRIKKLTAMKSRPSGLRKTR